MCDLDYGYMGFTRNIIKIKGKTYQNLLSETKILGKYVYDESTGEYTLTNPATGVWNTVIINYTRPIQAGEKLLIRVNIVKNTIETTQSPTIKITFSNGNRNSTGYIGVSSGFTGLFEHYCDGATVNETDNKRIHISTSSYSSGELVIKDIQVIPVSENLLLNNIELPTSINGIESACENENNVLLLKDNSITLPQPLRFLPNGVCDELVGNKLIQRVGKIIVDGTNNISISVVRDNTIRLFLTEPTIKNITYGSTLPFLSDTLLKTTSCWESDVEGIFQDNKENRFVVSISKNKLGGTTINDIKAYFAKNPITIYYELVAPIEHTIDINIKKIKKSKCYNNIKPTII